MAEYGDHFEQTLGQDIKNWANQTISLIPKPFISGVKSLQDIIKPLHSPLESMVFEGNSESLLFAITVGYYGHPANWLFVARTAVRGSEGVLLSLITRINPHPDFSPPWEELMVFSPLELPPKQEFIIFFNEGLSRAIDVLSDDVGRY